MADDASRLWHLTDYQFLTHFNTNNPQTTSWRLQHLTPSMRYALTRTLFKQRYVPAALLNAPVPRIPHGASGRPFAPLSATTPASNALLETRYLFSCSSPTATSMAPSLPVATPFDLGLWRTPFEAWGRRSPGWGPSTLAFGTVYIRLLSLYQAWTKADAPLMCVKLLPISLVHGAFQLARAANTPTSLAVADCLTIAFYFLLRPREYAGTPRSAANNLFRFQNVGLWISGRRLDTATCPIADLQAATFATLTFTTQKNGVRGEAIGHSRSCHPTLCI